MRPRRKKPEQDWPGLIAIIAFGVVAVAIAAGLLVLLARRPAVRGAQRASVPPFYASAAAAGTLPATLEPSRFPAPKIQRAYAVARQKPAVLAQQPCYCGCDRHGHRSLLECFKDEHAAGCSICIREANYASDLDARGKCAAEIRDGIIRGDWKTLQDADQR